MNSKILKLFVFIILVAGGFVLLDNLRDTSPQKIDNVILISIDTCRADFLSCYGYPRNTTPNIDAIAKNGILFENVISPVPMTLPAHTSMFTGMIPPVHGVHDNMLYRADDSLLTLAEIMKENGFSTAAVLAAEVLDPAFGLDQGFDDYYAPQVSSLADVQRPGNEINRIAMEWLDKHKDERFFLFLHYFDAHFPYTPPEPFKSSFLSDPEADVSSPEYIRDLYAAEVAFADHCIGQIVNKLKKLNLYDSSLIVLVADHGEMLNEHGELTHAYWIYQSAIKVPMIVKLPGRNKPKRITRIAGIIDIVPTVCSLLGIEPPSDIQGRDLTTYFDNKPSEERYLYCESLTATKYQGNSLLGVVSDNYKYIQTTRPELYDIGNDPAESNDLIAAKPKLARIMQDRLKKILEDISDSRSKAKQARFSQGIRDSLESLGYVASAMTEDYSFDQTRDDPKDLYPVHHLSSLLTHLCSRKKYDQARQVCEKLISIRPGYYKPYFQLAVIEMAQNNYEEAIEYLEKAVKLDHPNYLLHKHLGLAYYEVRKPRLAYVRLSNSLDLNPDQPDIHERIADFMYEKKFFQRCVIHLNESLKLKPDQPKLLNKLATLYSAQGKHALAVESLNTSLTFKPAQTDVISELGFIYYKQKNLELAIKQWSAALQLDPDQKNAASALAWVMATSKNDRFYDPKQALVLAKSACELTDSKDPRFLDTFAAALAANGNFTEAIKITKKAIQLAASRGRKDLVEDFKTRLRLYQTDMPYRE